MPEIKKYLNRDGLEEYNSLLPHSSGEMQDYVDDWLDAHPEATTTVQDGAISESKLADESVSLRTLADDTVHMLKGMMITGNLSGNVLSADDAYSAPPVALTVEGKSTQDGTPTPESPVEIVSIEQANIHFGDINVLLNLTQALRSVPNGTRDALSFAYLRPSTREGWAWYDVQRVVRVGRAILDGSESWTRGADAVIRMYTPRNDMLRATNYQQRLLCTTLHVYPYYNSVGSGVTGISGWSGGRYPGQNWFYVAVDGITTAEAMKQWFSDNPTEVLYELVTPTVTNLDPIELPFTAAPNFTIWNEPSTNLQIEYVRNANIVIQNIEQAIADQ